MRPPGRSGRRRRRTARRRGRCAGRSRRSPSPCHRIGTTTIERTLRMSSVALMLRSDGSVAASGMNTVSPRLERALELRVAIEVDDEVADRRILVARDEPHLVCARRTGRSRSGRGRTPRPACGRSSAGCRRNGATTEISCRMSTIATRWSRSRCSSATRARSRASSSSLPSDSSVGDGDALRGGWVTIVGRPGCV